jgi:predicted ATPase
MELFIPEFESILVEREDDNHKTICLKEKHSDKILSAEKISKGTLKLLLILSKILFEEKPTIMVLENIETDIHPKIVRELIDFFRFLYESKGHSFWFTTNSKDLIAKLTPEEVVVVNKVKGATVIKQFKGEHFFGLRMDEAWFANSLGGGVPW